MSEGSHTSTSTSVDPDALWICVECGLIYDPEEGDPDGGIPPGTTFADIPDSWQCPVCGARKSAFARYVP